MAAPLISVADARRVIVSSLEPLGTENLELERALGRVLAKDAVARVSHPPADVSAMDGYAVRIADVPSTPTKLKVVGESAAGHPWKGELLEGEAVRIFTGAYVPEAADTIVIQENAIAEEDESVSIIERPATGKNIRLHAQDFHSGDTVLIAPRRLAARDIGLLAAMNLSKITLFRCPRVGILSTGDEIVLPGETISEGQIVSANGPGLCAFVESQGAEAVHLGVVPDDLDALQEALSAVDQIDLLVTSGGVSVGDHDLLKRVMIENGLQIGFHKVAMRPGKPLLFGHFKQMPFMGLPGNPVSAMVCAILFLGPALAVLQGLPGSPPEAVAAHLNMAMRANDEREAYVRAVLQHGQSGLPTVSVLPTQDSAMVAALATANALIIRPPRAPAAEPGDTVLAIPLA